MNIQYELARMLGRMMFTALNVGCDVHGRERLPGAGPYILALNHASVLDPPLIWSFFPEPVYFVTKEEIHRVPVLGQASKRVGNIGIRRGRFDRNALRKAVTTLTERKRVLGIFVEGTRTTDGRLMPAKPGSALLVLRCGVPVVPAYIHGTFDIWPRGRIIPKWRPRVSLTLGSPIHYGGPQDNPAKERILEVADEISHALERLRSETLGGGDGSPLDSPPAFDDSGQPGAGEVGPGATPAGRITAPAASKEERR